MTTPDPDSTGSQLAVPINGTKTYSGETRFPLILQNAHRWTFYIAALYPPILLYEAIMAFRDENYEWGHFGLGTLILLVNAILLGIYTFSCHSCRHVIGGNSETSAPTRSATRLWNGVSRLNGNHGFWAQVSLFSVAFATSTCTCWPRASSQISPSSSSVTDLSAADLLRRSAGPRV